MALTVPAKPGRYPLVIYLPGLGEGATAGEVWRTAWTRAGYAVLSLQPLAEDAGAWSSARARTGDFALLARERYSDKAMSERLAALHDALRQLARRHAADEPPLERVDLSRVAAAASTWAPSPRWPSPERACATSSFRSFRSCLLPATPMATPSAW